MVGASVELVHELGQLDGGLRVRRRVLAVGRTRTPEEDVHESPQSDIPGDLLVTLQAGGGPGMVTIKFQSELSTFTE